MLALEEENREHVYIEFLAPSSRSLFYFLWIWNVVARFRPPYLYQADATFVT